MDAKSFIPPSQLDSLPAMVRNELIKLSPQKQEEYLEEYERKKKSMGMAYVAWFFLGWHYAYLGKWGWQIFFSLTLGGLVVWWLISAALIPGMVHNYNKDKAVDVMRNLKAVSAS